MQPATDATVLGDFRDVRFSRGGVSARFSRAGDRFVLRTEDEHGKEAAFDVAYTFGVDPLQQYLVPFPGGRLQATRVAWDARPKAEGGQRWLALHAGERIPPGDPLHWTGAAANWNFQCAECHSTDLHKGWKPADGRYETTSAEVNVACEACHGPGSAHVAWAERKAAGAPTPAGDGDGLVVALSTAPRAEWVFDEGAPIAHRVPPRVAAPELDACGRCHARRSVLAEPYVYGRPLLDTHRPALLDAGLYRDDGQIDDEVYEWGSFLQSRMYAAGVTCTDCHEPHTMRLRAAGNATCTTCHRAAVFDAPAHHHHAEGSAGASCVACHMPTRTYMEVDARHDHSLRVPRPDLTASIGTPNACAACHADRTAAWAAAAIATWRGDRPPPKPHFGEALHAARAGAVDGEARLVALADDPAQPGIARATAVRELAARLGPASTPALGRAAKSEDPLMRLAAAQTARMLEPEARARLVAPLLRDPVRAVRIDAARTLADAPEALASASDRDAESSALAEWRAEQAANADRPEAHVTLGAFHAERGERTLARAEYETALRLGPWFVPALLNLADLERSEGHDDAAARLLAQAIALAPESADAHHALGLLRVREGRLPDAIAELRRATELAPGNGRYVTVYALALDSKGDRAKALDVLEAHHRRRPGDREPLATLAMLSRDAGDLPRARAATAAWRALAPDDPTAKALEAELSARP